MDYRKVADLLGAGWATLDAAQALESLESEFMTPDISNLTESEAREFTDDPDAQAGLYARLSAPGYLDCTDWAGPFESIEHAMAYLIETYGDF